MATTASTAHTEASALDRNTLTRQAKYPSAQRDRRQHEERREGDLHRRGKETCNHARAISFAPNTSRRVTGSDISTRKSVSSRTAWPIRIVTMARIHRERHQKRVVGQNAR